jgi:DNA-binding CsgD family transcriptional regulator
MLTGVAPECHSRRTDKERTEHMAPTGSGEITPRDIQVVKWIACGMERDDVALTLNTSRSAVNRHMAKVMKLTATPSGTAAVAHVMALGLLRAQDVTSLTKPERRKRALLLAPDVMRHEHLTDAGLTRADVAAWLRSKKVATPIDDAEEHVNACLEGMATEFERGNARLPIPSPRRDPDAPRPPQQPERDS